MRMTFLLQRTEGGNKNLREQKEGIRAGRDSASVETLQ